MSVFADSMPLLRRGSQLLLFWAVLINSAQSAAAKDIVQPQRPILKTAAEAIYSPADSAQGDGLATTTIPTDSTHNLAPGTALLRSALLPGWGQLCNHKPYKAVFFAATSVGLLAAAVAEQRALDTVQNPREHEDRAARRNTRILFFALSVTFAALDAYVDAHLANFDAELTSEIRPEGGLLKLTTNLSP